MRELTDHEVENVSGGTGDGDHTEQQKEAEEFVRKLKGFGEWHCEPNGGPHNEHVCHQTG